MKKFLPLFVIVLMTIPLLPHVVHATVGATCAVSTDCAAGTEFCDLGGTGTCQPSGGSTGGAQGGGGFVPIAPIPGLTQGVDTTSASMAAFLNNLYKVLVGVAAVLAVIEIIWGGLQIATQESVPMKTQGRARILQAILGLILVLLPALVFSIINPSILNLDANWTPIKVNQTSNFGPAPVPANQTIINSGGSNTIQTNVPFPCSSNCSSELATCNSQGTNITGTPVSCSVVCVNGSGNLVAATSGSGTSIVCPNATTKSVLRTTVTIPIGGG
jgi:type IV secretory pathway VirB2 component (pilin)